MTNGADTSEFLTAGGPNEVSLKPHYADGKKKGEPDWYEGTGTYTVSNKSNEVLNVLVSASLAPATTGGATAQPLSLPADAIAVDKARVTLHPNQNDQAKVDLKVPPQPDGQNAVLSVVFKDELRPNNIAVTYDSTVKLGAGTPDGFPWWVLILIAALLILVGGGVAAFLVFRDGGGEEFAIPSVRGQTEAEATTLLQDGVTDCTSPCFTVESETRVDPDPEIAIGRVIATEPPSEEMAERGSTIKLVVMQGVEVPEVENATEPTARQRLEGACAPKPCFTVDPATAPSFEIAAGLALSTFPKAHQLAKSGSKVTLYMSKGAHKLVLSLEGEANLDESEAAKLPDIAFGTFFGPFILAQGDAVFTAFGPKAFGPLGCSKASGKLEVIAVSDLSVGTHICDRTTGKKEAELIVSGISTSNLTMDYVVWDPIILKHGIPTDVLVAAPLAPIAKP